MAATAGVTSNQIGIAPPSTEWRLATMPLSPLAANAGSLTIPLRSIKLKWWLHGDGATAADIRFVRRTGEIVGLRHCKLHEIVSAYNSSLRADGSLPALLEQSA